MVTQDNNIKYSAYAVDTNAEVNPQAYNLVAAELIEDQLIFQEINGFDKAIKDGFFSIKIPHDLDLSPGIKFSKNFFKKKNHTEDNEFFL